jgi:hypothetical protein
MCENTLRVVRKKRQKEVEKILANLKKLLEVGNAGLNLTKKQNKALKCLQEYFLYGLDDEKNGLDFSVKAMIGYIERYEIPEENEAAKAFLVLIWNHLPRKIETKWFPKKRNIS